MSSVADAVKRVLEKGELPTEYEVSQLCAQAKELLVEEPNLIPANAPMIIVGNIHGQFEDLLKLFKDHGQPPQQNYLLLGGYVNRGHKSLETFLYLLTFKVKYTDRIVLLRSNHESREITQSYGFYDECNKKFGSLNAWRDCSDVFECLPLAAHIDSRYFAVHGGLSPDIISIMDIQKIDRKRDVPNTGAFCNLLWSDPIDEIKAWSPNPRGCGLLFGKQEFLDFLTLNKLEKMYRGHQLMMRGYSKIFDDLLVTIWSAPNYCGKCGNLGSIMKLDQNFDETYITFEGVKEKAKINQASLSFTSFFFSS